MATKNFTALELNPMSTVMSILLIDMIGLICFVPLLNPLSMLLFQLFKPKFAAELAHDPFFCGNCICSFYTNLALKWPFRWSKWWMTAKHMDRLSDDQQIIYYDEVSKSDDVFLALRPTVWARIMRKQPLSDNLSQMLKTRDDLFEALLNLLNEKQMRVPLLHNYMECGTLPKSQMIILVNKACLEGKTNDFGVFANILCSYIERCGISKELLTKINDSIEASSNLKESAINSMEIYAQRCTAKRLYDLKSAKEIEEWTEFCAQGKTILYSAQQEMSPKQYEIFHRNGHFLDSDTIAYLLWYGGKDIARMIFRYEPKFGIHQNLKIEIALGQHDYLRSMLQKTIDATEQSLSKLINNGERLTDAQLNKMFDCPHARTLAANYLTKWPLPDELQMRMFEPDNAEELIKLYADLEQQSQDYHLTPEVRTKAVKDGFLTTSK